MLTKQEIMELRAMAIYKYFPKYKPVIIPAKPGERARMKEVLIEFDELKSSTKEYYFKSAQATIEADEKAGVLMLVEEKEAQINDHIIMPFPFDAFTIRAEWQVEELEEDEGDWKIAQRATTPVYQCAKEKGHA